jgi:hypothetical protein
MSGGNNKAAAGDQESDGVFEDSDGSSAPLENTKKTNEMAKLMLLETLVPMTTITTKNQSPRNPHWSTRLQCRCY